MCDVLYVLLFSSPLKMYRPSHYPRYTLLSHTTQRVAIIVKLSLRELKRMVNNQRELNSFWFTVQVMKLEEFVHL